MLHTRIIIIFCLCLLFSSCKKDLLHWKHWELLDTQTIDRLNALYFVNDSTGFAVGGERFYKATILFTHDGGKSWTYRTFPEAGKSLFGITQSPSGMLYAIGFDGKMLLSADTGKTWNAKQLWYLPYKGIYFPTPDRGIVVGGISYKTGYRNDIGSDGSYKPFDSLNYELNDLEMVNPAIGYTSGFGVILKTIDSGRTWIEQDIRNDNFTTVFALTTDIAWACGYNGSVYRTNDGGSRWDKQRNGNDITLPRYNLLDIVFKDEQHGYACGEDGLMIYTDDGGDHWMQYDGFTDVALRNIWLMRNGDLVVCGDEGVIYRFSAD